jgi:very-short-patch-repair endonuclease
VVCDFGHRAARIDFEADGAAYHSGLQVGRDKRRDRRMLRGGWITVRYDADDIRRHPRETLADVRRHIALRLP